MKAIFEAIVNAVVHRDYSKSGSKIRLFIFSNRLELYSPGALSNTLTVDTLISIQTFLSATHL
jgi:predicted HTH transcriptional regulator